MTQVTKYCIKPKFHLVGLRHPMPLHAMGQRQVPSQGQRKSLHRAAACLAGQGHKLPAEERSDPTSPPSLTWLPEAEAFTS